MNNLTCKEPYWLTVLKERAELYEKEQTLKPKNSIVPKSKANATENKKDWLEILAEHCAKYEDKPKPNSKESE